MTTDLTEAARRIAPSGAGLYWREQIAERGHACNLDALREYGDEREAKGRRDAIRELAESAALREFTAFIEDGPVPSEKEYRDQCRAEGRAEVIAWLRHCHKLVADIDHTKHSLATFVRCVASGVDDGSMQRALESGELDGAGEERAT